MLSDKEIEALKNGAYGVTRGGLKAKYMGKTKACKYGWVLYKDGYIDSFDNMFDHFGSYFSSNTSPLDIVGLWEDKPEPFDLERALAGEPVKTRDGCKAYVQIKIEQPNELTNYTIIGYGFNGNHREFLHWSENGMVLSDDISCDDIIGMWKEPEPVKPSADDLPKPIRELDDITEIWRITVDCDENRLVPHRTIKGSGWTLGERERAANGCYYATKEDCQAICDWLMGR